MERRKLKSTIEAIIFACGTPVETERIAQALELSEDEVTALCDELMQEYEEAERGIRIVRLNNSYQMCTPEEFAEPIRTVMDLKKNTPLSQAAAEVLAIIAYNQPVTKAFIEQVRGVDCSGVISGLIARQLIEEQGRLELPGKPLVYGTTEHFLLCFNLSSLQDLPPLPESDDDDDSDNNDDENRDSDSDADDPDGPEGSGGSGGFDDSHTDDGPDSDASDDDSGNAGSSLPENNSADSAGSDMEPAVQQNAPAQIIVRKPAGSSSDSGGETVRILNGMPKKKPRPSAFDRFLQGTAKLIRQAEKTDLQEYTSRLVNKVVKPVVKKVLVPAVQHAPKPVVAEALLVTAAAVSVTAAAALTVAAIKALSTTAKLIFAALLVAFVAKHTAKPVYYDQSMTEQEDAL